MQTVIVRPEFWELFPEGQINLLALQDIDNHQSNDQEATFNKLLESATRDAQQFITADVFSENEVVAQWRQALRKFKTKKGARSSIEALLKRVSQGHQFASINPLVDFYNSVSMKYGVPVGGEDVDQIDGSMTLGLATGGESFWPLGSEADSPALPNEMIYADDTGAICRCLNWREAKRTMLTENTANAILVIESVNKEQAQRADAAMDELQQHLQTYFKTTVKTFKLTKNKTDNK